MFRSKTFTLTREQLIPKTPVETFRFFEDASNLQLITPESLGFKILTPLPIEMREGTLIDYRIRLRGIPLRWRTRIVEYDPPHRFVDTQLRGPYKLWHHLHTFQETEDGTLMIDRVDYQLRFGALGTLVHQLYVANELKKIFDFRREAIGKYFED